MGSGELALDSTGASGSIVLGGRWSGMMGVGPTVPVVGERPSPSSPRTYEASDSERYACIYQLSRRSESTRHIGRPSEDRFHGRPRHEQY